MTANLKRIPCEPTNAIGKRIELINSPDITAVITGAKDGGSLWVLDYDNSKKVRECSKRHVRKFYQLHSANDSTESDEFGDRG